MDKVLDGLPQSNAYIDDVVIHSSTWEEHLRDVKDTLERLQQHNLTIKLSKCIWGSSQVKYLGHKISVEEKSGSFKQK